MNTDELIERMEKALEGRYPGARVWLSCDDTRRDYRVTLESNRTDDEIPTATATGKGDEAALRTLARGLGLVITEAGEVLDALALAAEADRLRKAMEAAGAFLRDEGGSEAELGRRGDLGARGRSAAYRHAAEVIAKYASGERS